MCGSSGKVDGLELGLTEEGEAPAVGRPERHGCAFGAGQDACLVRVASPHVDRAFSRSVARDKGDMPAIGRHLGCRSFVERRVVRWKHREQVPRWGDHLATQSTVQQDRGQAGNRDAGCNPTPTLATMAGGPVAARVGCGFGCGNAIQLQQHIAGARPAIVGISRQADADQPLQCGRSVRHVGGRAIERAVARCHLVDQCAESEDIGARVDGFPFELLGRHVLRCAQHGAVFGQRRSPCAPGGIRRHGDGRREPEVEQLRSRWRQHHVGRLQIPVDDAAPVGCAQPLGDLPGVEQDIGQGHRARLELHVQRRPVQQLHHEKIDVLVAADVVNGADVRMAQRRDGLRLTLKAVAPFRVV